MNEFAYSKRMMSPGLRGLPPLTRQSLKATRLKILGLTRRAEANQPQYTWMSEGAQLDKHVFTICTMYCGMPEEPSWPWNMLISLFVHTRSAITPTKPIIIAPLCILLVYYWFLWTLFLFFFPLPRYQPSFPSPCVCVCVCVTYEVTSYVDKNKRRKEARTNLLGANMRRLLNLLACLALFVVGCIINGPTGLRDSLDDSELLLPSNPTETSNFWKHNYYITIEEILKCAWIQKTNHTCICIFRSNNTKPNILTHTPTKLSQNNSKEINTQFFFGRKKSFSSSVSKSSCCRQIQIQIHHNNQNYCKNLILPNTNFGELTEKNQGYILTKNIRNRSNGKIFVILIFSKHCSKRMKTKQTEGKIETQSNLH